MYFQYVVNWLYRCMQVPVPIVVSNNVFGLVTIFDLFLFTIYIGVFIILIKYLITDNIDIKLGDTDINYSSNSYVAKQYRNSLNSRIKSQNISDSKFKNTIKVRVPKNSIAGHILSKKDK